MSPTGQRVQDGAALDRPTVGAGPNPLLSPADGLQLGAQVLGNRHLDGLGLEIGAEFHGFAGLLPRQRAFSPDVARQIPQGDLDARPLIRDHLARPLIVDVEREPTLRTLRDIGETVSDDDQHIRGRMVKDLDGRDLGTIDGLLVDAEADKVRFIEVASGGFLGLGETKSLIPVEAITKITDHEVHISHTREHVAGAPPYDPELAAKGADYFFGLDPYYGYQPTVIPPLVGYPRTRIGE